jgi:hypothetical protein
MEKPMSTLPPNRYDTYQWLLRAVGSYLDEEPSCRISLAEVSDGFIVRIQRALHKMEPQVEHFKRENLEEQLERLFSSRKPTKQAHHQGIWANFPNGHADFFRALGYELDQAKASNIVLDELEDGLVLTYTFPVNEDGSQWQKRLVRLGLDEIEAILNAAFERRKKATAGA